MSTPASPQYDQDSRALSIETPLGKDALLLRRMRGEEGLSRLFRFELELFSNDSQLDFTKVLGKAATVRLKLGDDTPRFFNGLIGRVWQMPPRGGKPTYGADFVPWTWLLTRTADCRVFQNLSVPAIVERVFQSMGFGDYALRLHRTYPTREYCAQYRETHFNFLSRLLEDAGIYYFFVHENGKHTFVMADVPEEHQPCPGQPQARFRSSEGDSGLSPDTVHQWAMALEVRPGRYSLRAFDFEAPTAKLMVSVDSVHEPPTGTRPEVYDYPGDFATRDQGEALVRTRIEEEEARATTIAGESTCRAFAPGFRFELTDHPTAELNQGYVLTHVRHEILEPTYVTRGEREKDGGKEPAYKNTFTCLPSATPFRPRRSTPRPVVSGPQTATVVGKAGEELWVDNYGRIKVQFHWDREGKRDESSSCWIRVVQAWAGRRYGSLFLPRVGQEVVVEFLEGDPDAPIVTGAVYNADQTPPYDLPAEQTKSTLKSSSSKGGSGFSEIRFEDKKGAEQLFVHAQRDVDLVVERESREFVGGDRHLMVEGARVERVRGEAHLEVRGNEVHIVRGALTHETGKDLLLRAGGHIVLDCSGGITLRSGGGFVKVDEGGVAIQGKLVRLNSGGAADSAVAQRLRQPLRASSAGAVGAGEGEPTDVDAGPDPFQLVVTYYQEQMKEHRDKLSPEDQAAADKAMAELEAAAAARDTTRLAAATQSLHGLLEKGAGHPIAAPPGFTSTVVDGKSQLKLDEAAFAKGATTATGTGTGTGKEGGPTQAKVPPKRVVRQWRGNFLAFEGYPWAFMYPSWPPERQRSFRAAYRAAGWTHLPIGIWGGYHGSGYPSFDFHENPQAYRELLAGMLNDGLIPCVFVHTDAVPGWGPLSRAQLETWASLYLPKIADLVPAWCTGWEFNQIDLDWSGRWAREGAEHIKWARALRRIVGPSALIYVHFSPTRITGYPNYAPQDGPQDEELWWKEMGDTVDGLLWQHHPEAPEWLVLGNSVGGKSLPHDWPEGRSAPADPPERTSNDIGDCHRIKGRWGKDFVVFEFAREGGRHKRVRESVTRDPRVDGFC